MRVHTSKQYPNSNASSPPPLGGGGPNKPCRRLPSTRPTRKNIAVLTSKLVKRKWPTAKTSPTQNELLRFSAYARPQAMPVRKRNKDRR